MHAERTVTMSDDAAETLGVEESETSGTSPEAMEEPKIDEAMNNEEPQDIPEEPVPVVEAEIAEETRPGLEPDREDEKPEPKPSAQDRKLTKENASLRKRLREVESVLKAREEADLSEQERQARRLSELEAKYSDAEQRLRESALSLSVSSEAQKLNVVDPDAAVKLIDTSVLEYDPESNKWDGIDEALAALVEDRPWLVKQSQPSAPKETSPANPARRRNRLTREALAQMTDAEIAALPWEDVHAALQSS
jgi:hypothetical protein